MRSKYSLGTVIPSLGSSNRWKVLPYIELKPASRGFSPISPVPPLAPERATPSHTLQPFKYLKTSSIMFPPSPGPCFHSNHHWRRFQVSPPFRLYPFLVPPGLSAKSHLCWVPEASGTECSRVPGQPRLCWPIPWLGCEPQIPGGGAVEKREGMTCHLGWLANVRLWLQVWVGASLPNDLMPAHSRRLAWLPKPHFGLARPGIPAPGPPHSWRGPFPTSSPHYIFGALTSLGPILWHGEKLTCTLASGPAWSLFPPNAPRVCPAWSLDHRACSSEPPPRDRAGPACFLPTSPYSGRPFISSIPHSIS